MPRSIDKSALAQLESLDSQARYEYLVEQLIENQQVWILSDKAGFVLLNSDGQDCLPVWPHSEAASEWVKGDWKACSPQAIALDVWQERWTAGLIEDKFYIATFPNQAEEALVIEAGDFDEDLSNAAIDIKKKDN